MTSPGPLGGARGEWAYRSLRFHLPIAFGSAVLLALFMTLPPFDPQTYPLSDMGSAGAIPQRRGEVGSMGHADGQTPAPSPGHGGGQAPTPGHDADRSQAPGHGGSQTGTTNPDGLTESLASRYFTQRFTVASGYVATGLLTFTLLVGPANLLLRKRNPVSSYLRRDLGMWTAVFSVVHVIYGSLLHSSGQLAAFLNYFVMSDGSPRLNSFGLGNWTGLAATVIVVGLLAISNDLALRTLKAPRWKLLQRLNYALFVLVVLHAFFYGALLRVTSPFTVLLVLSVIAVFVGQAVGFWLWRRRYARRAATPA